MLVLWYKKLLKEENIMSDIKFIFSIIWNIFIISGWAFCVFWKGANPLWLILALCLLIYVTGDKNGK